MFTYDTPPQKTVKPVAFSDSTQGKQTAANSLLNSAGKQVFQRKSENNTGLPDILKARVENISGISLDDVKVHYNSSRPAQFRAFAYTQGTDIHVAPGQERHLPHEAWHVVQQKQGRVRPTGLLGGIGINDDKSLEREADVMGQKSMASSYTRSIHNTEIRSSAVQCASDWKTPSLEEQSENINPQNPNPLQKVIHHMLPRKLLEDFCLCLNEAQQQQIKDHFAPNPRDKHSTPHRILKSLHSNLVVGPEVSKRLDDEDHLRGPRGEQQYFFDATGGVYTAVSAIYRQIFEKMKSVVAAEDRPCPPERFNEIMRLLQQAEEEYIKMSCWNAKDDFNPRILKARSAEIWREVKVQGKPYYVKRSNEYNITLKKTLPYYMDTVRDLMQGLRFEAVCDYETDILTCTKRVADSELDQNMEQLSEMYDKKDALSIQGIFP